MRILLINPPVEKLQHRGSPSSWTEGLGTYPPLGMMYLAAYLEARGHRVAIMDMVARRSGERALEDELRGFGPDIVGITCLTFNLLASLQVAERVKRVCPDTVTVLGGPHPTIYPRETARQPGVDYAAVGDGEEILAELARDPGAGGTIPGLLGREIAVEGGPEPEARKVDRESTPFPARHLVDARAYRSIVSRRLPMTSMVTGAGCPCGCVFCSVPRRKNPYFRSVEHVIEEMVHCQRAGYREIMFFDDIFTLDRERTSKLCRMIRDRGIKLGWDCRTRVDCVDGELLAEMRAAGCFRVQYGVESGSAAVLESLRKGFTVERAYRAIAETRAAGISASASFMLGNPGESEPDIEKTLEFALRSGVDYAQFSICTPFPFTPLYRRGLESGLFEEDYWKRFAEQPSDSFIPSNWCEKYGAGELRRWQNSAFRKFYYRPRYAIRQLGSIRSFSEAGRKLALTVRLAMETARS